MSLFDELKRRNVFKVAIAYVIITMLAVTTGLFDADRFLAVGAGLARDQRTQDSAPDNRAQSALL